MWRIPSAVPLALLATMRAAPADGLKVEWTYNKVSETMTGAEDWGRQFPDCAAGLRSQSPINVEDSYWRESIDALKFSCKPMASYQVQNVQAQVKVKGEGGECVLDVQGEGRFHLDAFHFHSPSEHTLNGKQYDLEVHFVHLSASEPKKISVVGVLFEAKEGAPDNAWLAEIWRDFPTAPLTAAQQAEYFATQKEFSVNAVQGTGVIQPLLPMDEYPAYARYTGSLTTPPCSEGVIWNLVTQTQQMSLQQLALWKQHMHYNAEYNTTARPVQRLYDRVIYHTSPSPRDGPIPDFDAGRAGAVSVNQGLPGSPGAMVLFAVAILLCVFFVARRPNGHLARQQL